jgi:putative membrane protein
MHILLHWALSTLAVMAAAYLVPGVSVDGWFTALIVALVLGFINAIIKPLFIILTLPVTVLTLGLFILVIDGLLILLAARVVDGFAVAGFWPALGFAIVAAIISSLLGVRGRRNG